MDNAARPRNALAAIDLLRFAAAMMVVLHHYFGSWALEARLGMASGASSTDHPTNDWLHSGWVGVEIFFVISGYVIALSAANAGAADFARRRLLRLWPGALVCSTITALTLSACGMAWGEIGPRYFASAMLWPQASQLDPVYWTLGIECSFYALVTLLLALGRWQPVKVAIGLSLWSFAYWTWAIGIGGLASAPVVDRLAELSLARFGAFFGLGILIQQGHRDPGSVKGWMFLPSLIAAPACVVWHAATQGGVFAEPLMLFIAGVAVVILASGFQGTLGSAQLKRVTVALGLATYPLYLLHHYVGEALLLWAASAGIGPALAVGPVILLMIALALFVAVRVEPLLRTQLDPYLRLDPRPISQSAS